MNFDWKKSTAAQLTFKGRQRRLGLFQWRHQAALLFFWPRGLWPLLFFGPAVSACFVSPPPDKPQAIVSPPAIQQSPVYPAYYRHHGKPAIFPQDPRTRKPRENNPGCLAV